MIINLLGILLIGFIVWWFWLYREPEQRLTEGEISIEVKNGVYMPAHIKVPAGKSFILKFVRLDPSPCAEIVQIPALEISENLPLNKPYPVSVPALDAGEYDFHCQMQMYRGVITVV